MPIRIGYPDQHRPPYYLGTGSAVANPAGASVDLIREIAAAENCPVTLVRLPLARLRNALATGAIDAMPMEAHGPDILTFALPMDATGKPDVTKALRLHTIMFVRTGDPALRYSDIGREFGQRWLGINHAAPVLAPLRQLGFKIDDGALDAERNLEKLIRNRIDGFAMSVASPGDIDVFVAARFGTAVARVERPMYTHNIWLAVSKDHYARNQPHVDAMWNWVGALGRARFAKLVRKYETGNRGSRCACRSCSQNRAGVRQPATSVRPGGASLSSTTNSISLVHTPEKEADTSYANARKNQKKTSRSSLF